jgi:hypothetical protein
MKIKLLLTATLLGPALLSACGDDISYVQRESPANPYKDYLNKSSAVVGVGEPVSTQRMKANATFSVKGRTTLEEAMTRISDTYNIAVRYGDGVRTEIREDLVVSDLTFDETRSYLEDVYGVQIIREGERRVLVLPSVSEMRIKEFSPGTNVSLSQVVRGLADQCDMNLVISENKQKIASTTVTTNFRDISCADAFEAILSPHGMSLVDRGDFYSIGGLPLREWVLNLHEPKREETRVVSYVSEFGGNEDDSGGGTSTIGGSSNIEITSTRDLWQELYDNVTDLIDKSCEPSSGGGSVSVDGLLAPPETNLTPISEDTGTEDGGEDSGEGESSQDGGSFECGYVRVNKSVGLVQMRAPQSIIDEADEIIKRIEDIASRRLMVEARVIAVSRNRDFEAGGRFGGGFNLPGTDRNISGGFVPGLNSYAPSITGRIASFLNNGDGGLIGTSGDTLEATVRLVETFGTTYQLMQPTIEVMDRQTATLIDGRNERYFIREGSVETDDSGVTTRNVTAEEHVQFVGLQFSVTAQVAEEGGAHTVSLQIPMTDIARFESITNTFDGEDYTDQIPIATTRLIDQKVRLRDGEVKVIGGLTRTLAVDTESGIPLLKDIPVAGKALGEEDISYEEVEFLVLLQVRRLQ